jgi:hypothetical protein
MMVAGLLAWLVCRYLAGGKTAEKLLLDDHSHLPLFPALVEGYALPVTSDHAVVIPRSQASYQKAAL